MDTPLFLPLKSQYFNAFAEGTKTVEYRLYGPRWNERTCYPGRPVVLSCGYGKSRRLTGRVMGLDLCLSPADMLPGWVDCYGAASGPAICISILIDHATNLPSSAAGPT